jgi:hypothetical protein
LISYRPLLNLRRYLTKAQGSYQVRVSSNLLLGFTACLTRSAVLTHPTPRLSSLVLIGRLTRYDFSYDPHTPSSDTRSVFLQHFSSLFHTTIRSDDSCYDLPYLVWAFCSSCLEAADPRSKPNTTAVVRELSSLLRLFYVSDKPRRYRFPWRHV